MLETTEVVIYYASLLMCITLGSHYKRIAEVEMKRNYGAGLGILVACLVCGHHIYHTVLLVWGNVIIIKCCNKRYVHQISMLYTWTYLMYLHAYITSVYILWIHQTMALRLVGLAFEVNSLHSPSTTTLKNMPYSSTITVEPSAVDIIAYSYFFVGLHRGPYFRWKIYHEHFSISFSELGDYRVITKHKLKKSIVFMAVSLLIRLRFPPNAYDQNSFYEDHGSDYRYLYNLPQLVMLFLNYQVVMLLCTGVCTEAGFGIYPAKCKALPGHGPTAQTSLLKIAGASRDIAMEQDFSFGMLKCFDNRRLLIGPMLKDTLRGWDMPTRYWFWSYIYHNLLKASKEVRSACSFFAWTVWSGPNLQQWIATATLWVYIHLEEEYSSLYNTTGSNCAMLGAVGGRHLKAIKAQNSLTYEGMITQRNFWRGGGRSVGSHDRAPSPYTIATSAPRNAAMPAPRDTAAACVVRRAPCVCLAAAASIDVK